MFIEAITLSSYFWKKANLLGESSNVTKSHNISFTSMLEYICFNPNSRVILPKTPG